MDGYPISLAKGPLVLATCMDMCETIEVVVEMGPASAMGNIERDQKTVLKNGSDRPFTGMEMTPEIK
ncbi:MAG: hypothetical protein JWR19_3875 [Pedosphaera sp.]|nr:hypothetical protein [Pedosphaera sp.]